MATPYLQIQVDETPSTQDLARDSLEELPVVVLAQRQGSGRGRSGSGWANAPRGLAVSVAMEAPGEDRPVSLMAGVAAVRAIGNVDLKWPNDLITAAGKAGGILVERSDARLVVGLGVNLWWPDPPEDIAALYPEDPGERRHAELGALWAAELIRLLDDEGWPHDEYRAACDTLGREITWEPDGHGVATDVGHDGSLIVDIGEGRRSLHSGAVAHIRT